MRVLQKIRIHTMRVTQCTVHFRQCLCAIGVLCFDRTICSIVVVQIVFVLKRVAPFFASPFAET